MHKIIIGKRKRTLPSNWEEVTEKSLSDIVLFLIAETKWRKLRVLCRMLKVTKSELEKITPLQVMSLLDLVEFLFSSYPVSPTVKTFKAGFTKFYSPAKLMESSSIIELAYADFYYEQFVKTQRVDFLNKMVASLYRPTDPWYKRIFAKGTDRRELFDSFKTEEYANKINLLPIGTRLSIMLFFLGCKKGLAKTYGPAFNKDYSKDEDLPEEVRAQFKPSEKTSDSNSFGYFSLINSASKTGQYGDYEKTGNTSLHIILYNITMDILTAKKAK